MQFRGNYTLTFHQLGGVTQTMLPEPPADSPITLDEALSLPPQAVVSIIKRAICNRAIHHGHAVLMVMGDDAALIPCGPWRRSNATIQFLLEVHPETLLHPDLFPDSPEGSERHGR